MPITASCISHLMHHSSRTHYGIGLVLGVWLLACGCQAVDEPGVDIDPFLAPANHSAPAVAGLHDPLASQTSPTPPLWNRLTDPYQQTFAAGLAGIVTLLNRPLVEAWDRWALTHLQDGDVVFLQTENSKVLGVMDFSQLTRDVTASAFTHVGVAAVEGGRVYLYDTDVPGPGRRPFGQLMAYPFVNAVAVKRPRPQWQGSVPAVLAYCRAAFQARIPFDKRLRLDNDRLYCSEFVEVAFRSAGVSLSEPVRWDRLPGIADRSLSVAAIRLVNGNRPDERVVVPGNAQLGLWSSPALEPLLPITLATAPPLAGSDAR